MTPEWGLLTRYDAPHFGAVDLVMKAERSEAVMERSIAPKWPRPPSRPCACLGLYFGFYVLLGTGDLPQLLEVALDALVQLKGIKVLLHLLDPIALGFAQPFP